MPFAYSVIMTVAIGAAWLLSRRRQTTLSLTRGQRLGLAVGAFCGAMIAAKLPFIFGDWQRFASGAAWLDNGKTIVVGLVGGYFGVELAKWALGIRVKTGDSFAVPVAVGIAIGRLACFVAGCCYGTHTSLPWGVDFGDGPRHPTQLYEFVFHMSAAAALSWMERRELCRGQRIKLYIMAYLVYRFATEFIRPEPTLFLSLTGNQWACLAWLPVFAALLAADRRLKNRCHSCGA